MANDTITGWQDAAAASGRSIASLRRMVAGGELEADRDDQGRYVFSRGVLAALRGAEEPREGPSPGTGQAGPGGGPPPRKSPLATEIESELYERLDAGEPLSSIALCLGLDPTWARVRAAEWAKLRDVDSACREEIGRSDAFEERVAFLEQKVVTLKNLVDHLSSEYELAVVLLDQLVSRHRG